MSSKRKQIKYCRISGTAERTVVRSMGGRIIEEFDNRTADRLAIKMQPDAFERACQWVRDSLTVTDYCGR